MATAPAYAATPVAWYGLVPSTADTSWTAPTHVTSLGTAGSGGTKINEIDVTPVGTVVAGLVNIFAYNGSAYYLIPNGSVTVAAYTTSTTAPAPVTVLTFDNLVLPSSSWSLAVSNTVSGNVSLVLVTAFGASF